MASKTMAFKPLGILKITIISAHLKERKEKRWKERDEVENK